MKLENLFRALILFPLALMPVYGFVDFSVFIQIGDSNIDVKHLEDLSLQSETSIAALALMLVWFFIASGMMFFFKKRAFYHLVCRTIARWIKSQHPESLSALRAIKRRNF